MPWKARKTILNGVNKFVSHLGQIVLQLCHGLGSATGHGEDEKEGVECKYDGPQAPYVAELRCDHEKRVVGEEVGGDQPWALIKRVEVAGYSKEGSRDNGSVHRGDKQAEPKPSTISILRTPVTKVAH